MYSSKDPLTIATATALGTVLSWAQRNARITWAVDYDTERLITGVARSVGDENGNFAFDRDVRDMYLRVSSTFEYFLPIPEVLDMHREGYIFEET